MFLSFAVAGVSCCIILLCIAHKIKAHLVGWPIDTTNVFAPIKHPEGRTIPTNKDVLSSIYLRSHFKLRAKAVKWGPISLKTLFCIASLVGLGKKNFRPNGSGGFTLKL